jgi:chemotaxis protein MotB
MLAQELGNLPNKVTIEGHTDSKPYAGARGYGNWELSADRANAALQQAGLRADQVSQVRGFADPKLHKPENPLDASNRRITMIVQYTVKADQPDSAAAQGERAAEPKPAAETKHELRLPPKPETFSGVLIHLGQNREVDVEFSRSQTVVSLE